MLLSINLKILWAFSICLLMSGCAFSDLEKDLEKFDRSSHIYQVTISTDDPNSHTLLIVALDDLDGSEFSGFRAVSKPGPVDLDIRAEQTYLFAFEDRNMDFRYQADEQYGWGAFGMLLTGDTDTGERIEIAIGSNENPPPARLIDQLLMDKIDGNTRFHFGTVTPLDHDLLSLEFAKKGLWQPFAFLEAGGTGIHFMEPYDPDRIPVLFVHGIQGAPANFKPLIPKLDLSLYQPWYFSYPSGLRLNMVAHGLHQFLDIVQRNYQFQSLHIIAHSMGGLVARGALNGCLSDNDCDFVTSLTTISTPWDGVASAKAGVEWAPTVVPVWRDLDPDGEFLVTLFDRPLPSEIPHNLLFGFHVESFFGADSSDGVITLTSQLREEAQAGASVVHGYDEGHVSILGNDDVANLINALMDKQLPPNEQTVIR